MVDTGHDVINRYFRAVAEDDIQTLASCFSDDAVVTDEDKTHRGRLRSARWREQTKSAYQ